MQVLLDVVEVLDGLVGSQAAGVPPLVLGRADLFQRLVERVSEKNKTNGRFTGRKNKQAAASPKRTEISNLQFNTA